MYTPNNYYEIAFSLFLNFFYVILENDYTQMFLKIFIIKSYLIDFFLRIL